MKNLLLSMLVISMCSLSYVPKSEALVGSVAYAIIHRDKDMMTIGPMSAMAAAGGAGMASAGGASVVVFGIMIGVAILLDHDSDGSAGASTNVAEDLDALVTFGIYSQAEADSIRSELAGILDRGEGSIVIDAAALSGLSPDEAITEIQTGLGSSELLAVYIGTTLGVQVN